MSGKTIVWVWNKCLLDPQHRPAWFPPAPESCSISVLICHTCQVDGLSYLITNVGSKSKRSHYFVYIKKTSIIKLFTSTCERNRSNKVLHLYFCTFRSVFTVCSRFPKMTQKACRFESWCTVTTSLTLWPVLGFHSQLHSLSYCKTKPVRDTSCWSQVYKHQNITYAALFWFFQQGSDGNCWCNIADRHF